MYLKTAISGVDKGIKLLSDINLLLFLVLMAASYLVGDLAASLRMGGRGLLDYICYFLPDSVRLSSQGDSSWIENWRVFYWAWWLSWAPFVGTFIARISKGRTVRQFLLGVIVIPTIVSVLWFTAFGGLALSAAADLPKETLLDMIATPELTLFQILEKYPLGHLLCLIAMGLLVTFFVTSANSATFVLAMLTSGGKLDPPVSKKVFWGLLIAVLALALIFSGGISMIQTISIVIAFPYLLFLILICISLVLAFWRDSSVRSAIFSGIGLLKAGGEQRFGTCDLRVQRQLAHIGGQAAKAPLKAKNAYCALPSAEDTVSILLKEKPKKRGAVHGDSRHPAAPPSLRQYLTFASPLSAEFSV